MKELRADALKQEAKAKPRLVWLRKKELGVGERGVGIVQK
jgi:hypothetical protein